MPRNVVIPSNVVFAGSGLGSGVGLGEGGVVGEFDGTGDATVGAGEAVAWAPSDAPNGQSSSLPGEDREQREREQPDRDAGGIRVRAAWRARRR